MASTDIKAHVRAFPNVGIPVPPSKVDEVAAARQAQANEEAAQEAAAKLDEKSGSWIAFGADFSFLEPISFPLKILDKTLGVLEKILAIIQVPLKILQLFINAFGSFSSLVAVLLEFVKSEVNQWAQDLAGSGVFMNILVPPAFTKNPGSVDIKNLSSGGFQGFLSRLSVSLYNRADPNRPQFSQDGVVGGFIMMVDAESLDGYFRSMKQLDNLFGILEKTPVLLEPPAPVNIRSTYGLWISDEYSEGKLGVKLEWDAPPGFAGFKYSYRISRSTIQGGTLDIEQEAPEKLWGPRGFIRAIKERIANIRASKRAKDNTYEPSPGQPPEAEGGGWPYQIVYKYEDPEFNGGSPAVVAANPFNGNGEYIDYDIHFKSDGDPKHLQYYYVLETGFNPDNWGPQSPEQMVPIEKDCIDADSIAVVQHKNGRLEFLSSGVGELGAWSSVQMKYIVPFLPLLIDQMNKLLNKIIGMVEDSSDAFSTFIEAIQERIAYYKKILEILLDILEQIKNILLGPEVAFLFVPPGTGGVRGFLQRVRQAEQPDDGFSGPGGITAGIVMLFGGPEKDPFGNDDQQIIEEQSKNIQKSLSAIMDLLTGG